jgi:hypothetical protein
MTTTRTETAKLILEFLKTLIWPLTVALTLIIFYQPIKTLISERLEKLEVPGGTSLSFLTGTKKPDGSVASSPGKPEHPDIYFNVRDVSSLHNRTDCVQHGIVALNQSGFEEIRNTEQGVAYGYKQGYVGVVSCGLRQDLAFIMVSGPFNGLEEKLVKLDDAFLVGIPIPTTTPSLPKN